MGTNYYLMTDACAHCKRGDEKIHLGKCSAGWAFSFRGYRKHKDWLPEGIEKVESLEEWRQLVNTPNTIVVDEYGVQEDKEEFIKWAEELSANVLENYGKVRYHARYMETHKFRQYSDDQMIDGQSFSFQEFS